MNILIGLKETPVKGGLPSVEVFYAGREGAELRKKHAALLKSNKDDSRFSLIQNPLLTPLTSVVTDTEDHPDEIAARKRRAEIADALTKNQIKPETKPITK